MKYIAIKYKLISFANGQMLTDEMGRYILLHICSYTIASYMGKFLKDKLFINFTVY